MSVQHVSRSPEREPSQPLEALKAPGMEVSSVSDLLNQPLARRVYNELLASRPTYLPKEITLPHRRRPALEKSLVSAFERKDPVRELVIFVRAYALFKSVPEYAGEVGLKPHSLSHLEERGFDPARSVALTYGTFLRDWARRAEADPKSAPFFRWAQQRLERLLVGEELGTPLGLLLKWQIKMGAPSFADMCGLTSAGLSSYRTFKKNITFSELIQVGEALGYNPGGARTSITWNATWMKEVRRVFFHHSMSLTRSASATKIHMMLTWTGAETTEAGLRRCVPDLTEEESAGLARFDPVSPIIWRKVRNASAVTRRVPAEVLDGVDAIISRETQLRNRVPESSRLAVSLIRFHQFSTKTVARLLGIYEGLKPREGTALVRGALFEKRSSDRAPWGVVAALLSKDSATFERMLLLRAQELSDQYLRRTGHPLQPTALYRRIWGGEPPGEQGDSSLADGITHARADTALARLVAPLILGAPDSVLSSIVELRGLLPVWQKAASSDARFAAIMSKQVVPNYPEYVRILKAARITPNVLHEIGWRDSFGGHLRSRGAASPFGLMQRRILKTLIFSENETRGEFLKKLDRNRGADASWFQTLDIRGEIPAVIMKRLLAMAGIEGKSPRMALVRSLFEEKDYPKAIRRWFRSGMEGLTDSEKRDVTHLLQVGPNICQEKLFSVGLTGVELLTLSHRLKDGSVTAMPPSWKRTVRGVFTIMKLFPGVTLDEIREVFSRDGKVLWAFNQPTTIPRSWLPQFEQYGDRLLRKRGVLDSSIRPTQFLPNAVRLWRSRALDLLGPSASDCQSFFSVLFPENASLLNGDSSELHKVLCGVLTDGSPFVNLESDSMAQLLLTFKDVWMVDAKPAHCRVMVGASLAGRQKQSMQDVLSVGEALDRLLTFLVLDRRGGDIFKPDSPA